MLQAPPHRAAEHQTAEQQAAPEAPLLGKPVRIVGLEAKPRLNGKTGHVASFDAASGRYAVTLDGGGEGVRVRGANLEMVAVTEGDASKAEAATSVPMRTAAAATSKVAMPSSGDAGSKAAVPPSPDDGWEAIANAVRSGDVKATAAWLDAGGGGVDAAITIKGPDGHMITGCTMLMNASACGHLKLVELLI